MVLLGTAGRDQFIVDVLRKREIDEVAAVQMSDFTRSHLEFDAAEPMRGGADIRPARHLGADAIGGWIHLCHYFILTHGNLKGPQHDHSQNDTFPATCTRVDAPMPCATSTFRRNIAAAAQMLPP